MTATIPEAPMPRDRPTHAIVEARLDDWWASLSPGQKMTLYTANGPGSTR